jgi:arylsulfatase A-like enzyme
MGLRGEPRPPLRIPRLIIPVVVGVLLLSAGLTISLFRQNSGINTQAANRPGETNQMTRRPNILLIGSDGVNATNLSLYGYERDTTPVLRELANTSLVAENAFANSANSTGSITSMLTGKSPAQTRVLYPPNILNGSDAFQHLPGILRNEGYHNAQFAISHYIDADKVNLLDGFDTINGQTKEESKLARAARAAGLGVTPYFASLMIERITDRALHISYIRDMENPFTIITQPVNMAHDNEKINQLTELLQESESPVFAHVHLMGTHGPRFLPNHKVFSSGITQNEDWMLDFYDDSILDFDSYIDKLVANLEQSDDLNNTILIIYSDHPVQYNVRLRVPLLIRFPNGEYAGRITSNVQNLDIPPTILDYLGMSQPDWMAGHSLLEEDLPQNKLIFSSWTTYLGRVEEGHWAIELSRIEPPFYHFSFVIVFNCHKWYWFDLINQALDSGEVHGHTMPCTEENLLTMDQIEEGLAEYLFTNGFDISTLAFP